MYFIQYSKIYKIISFSKRENLKIENPVCGIANYLFPECKVIGGNIEVCPC